MLFNFNILYGLKKENVIKILCSWKLLHAVFSAIVFACTELCLRVLLFCYQVLKIQKKQEIEKKIKKKHIYKCVCNKYSYCT